MEPTPAPTDVFDNSDTITLELRDGDEVVCLVGQLKGVRGKMVGCRAHGRVLIWLAPGMFIEVPRFCVQRYHA